MSETNAPPLARPSWSEAIEAVGPAWLLVAIRSRLSTQLQNRLDAEDILQEVLVASWQAWAGLVWRGARAFRSYLLEIADHRIRDAAEHLDTWKRGGRVQTVALPEGAPAEELKASTTPGRIAILRELADCMQAALLLVPEELREVVRLRVFEELPMHEVATRLGIGVSAAKHRFRKGAEIYQRQLRKQLSGRQTPSTARS